jgi:hypothetical protein
MQKPVDSPSGDHRPDFTDITHEPPLHAPSTASLLLAALIATIAWLSLAAQTDITVHRMMSRGLGVFDGIERLASYLTNLTIFIVALTFSGVASRGRSSIGRLFRRPQVVTAVVVYIVFVGLAYNLLLRYLWTPSGYRAVLNECLHTVVPLLSAVYWVLYVPRFHLKLRHCLLWMIYPLAYLIVTLWRGGESDFYPYPFIDVGELGYPHVLLNASLLVLAFIILMGVFIALNHRRAR